MEQGKKVICTKCGEGEVKQVEEDRNIPFKKDVFKIFGKFSKCMECGKIYATVEEILVLAIALEKEISYREMRAKE